MEPILELIRNFADQAHGTQTRKYTPDKYIVHPVRVMEMCRKYTSDLPVLASALLHDVLEDTPVSKEKMKEFLLKQMDHNAAERTLELVIELTDVYVKDDYPQWNRRKRKNMELKRLESISPDAQTVKYADIIDNSRDILQHDKNFARVFLNECRTLLQNMQKGDQHLYREALKTVDEGLQIVRKKLYETP